MILVQSFAPGTAPGLPERCSTLLAAFYEPRFGADADYRRRTVEAMRRFAARFDPARDAWWWLQRGADVVGSLAVDGQDAGDDRARLRWFYVDAAARGRGLGRHLLGRALRFAKATGRDELVLTTNPGLDAAVHLYRSHGFEPAGEAIGHHAGRPILLRGYRLTLQVAQPA